MVTARSFDWGSGDLATRVAHVGGLAAPLLIIQARRGFLACAYIDLGTCDKLREVGCRALSSV
jgi:hypothetical protein